jgi:hypothetical protein
MEKTKLLTIAVIGLLILNIVTVTFLWLGRHHPPLHGFGEGRNGRPPAAAFLIKELNFDENQTASYDRLREAHHQKNERLQDVLRQNREALFSGIATNDTSKIAEIGEIQKEFDRSTFLHFQEVRTLCRPDQQPKFDQIIGEVLRIMGNKQSPSPPPAPRPPHN